MHTGRFLFSELIAHLPHKEFQKCVTRYDNGSHWRKFSYWDQYLAMAFAQLTYRESLRDIEACLRSVTSKLYHLGFRGKVARTTLADANESRDWRIFADFAQVLIGIARPLYANDPIGVDLDRSLYALDSTTIDLCLALFPWARFRKHKAAVKMHTLLDLHGNIPTFIRISDGKLHDVNVLDDIPIEAGAFYVFDRGYLDFERLYQLTMSSAFFVTRTKQNVIFQRRYSRPVDHSTGVRSDQTVILTTVGSATSYPDALRRVSYVDAETDKHLVFLTNNFDLPALTITQIYKCRWQVEFSSSGSNSTCESRCSTVPARTPSRLKSGSQSRSTCWLLSFASAWDWKSLSTKFYRSSASPSSKKRPFYRHFKHATPKTTYPTSATN